MRQVLKQVGFKTQPVIIQTPNVILFMEEILHHLGCIKPCKVNNVIFTMLTGAGFLPSTVLLIPLRDFENANCLPPPSLHLAKDWKVLATSRKVRTCFQAFCSKRENAIRYSWLLQVQKNPFMKNRKTLFRHFAPSKRKKLNQKGESNLNRLLSFGTTVFDSINHGNLRGPPQCHTPPRNSRPY